MPLNYMLEMILMTILCYICINTYNFIKNSKKQSVKGQKILEFSKECWDKIKKGEYKASSTRLKKTCNLWGYFYY